MLYGFTSDTNTHTLSASYSDIFSAYADKAVMPWTGTVWTNDTKTARVVLFSDTEDVGEITASAGVFRCATGEILPDSCVSLRFMADTRAHDDGLMVADIITEHAKTTLASATLRSLWIAFDIPTGTAPGLYCGEITVAAANASVVFPMTLEVLAVRCPDPKEAGVQLELWQYPYSIDRYYSGMSTRDYFGEGIEALYRMHLCDRYAAQRRAELAFYAAAGGRAVTVTCVEDPWNSQTPDPYPSMVKWKKQADGTFSFDYTDLDEWVQMNLAEGIDGQIKTFSIACWGNRVTYYSEAAATVETLTLTPGTEEWKAVWRQFLISYMAHMKQKGWFEKTYISMDERDYDEVAHLLDLVESVRDENGVCFKSSLCVFLWDTEPLFDRVDDLSLSYGMDAERVKALSEKRRAAGKLTTLYTCGAACSALKSTPADGVYSILCTVQKGTDGFLRWAINAYNEAPLETSYNVNFAPGDVFLIYPADADSTVGGVRTSHRFEKLREGLRAAAKIKTLRTVSDDMRTQVNAVLDSFCTQNGGDTVKEVPRILTALDDLARTV